MTAELSATERVRASLELFYAISRELAAQLDLGELLKRILQLTIANVGAESGSILVLDERGQVTEGAVAYGGEVSEHTAEQLAETFEHGLAGWVFEERKPAYIPSTHDDPRWLQRTALGGDESSRSAISVPLLVGERVVGVLTMVHPIPGHFSEDDLTLLQAIAEQAGVAVENARLFKAEQVERRFASTLQEIGRIVNSTLEASSVFPQVLDQLRRVVEFDSASIFVLDRGQLRLAVATGFKDAQSFIGETIPDDASLLVRQVIESTQPIVVSDVQQHEGWLKKESLPGSESIRGWIGAPLVLRDKAVGVLCVDSNEPGVYTSDQVEVVAAFADHAATAVVNAQLFSETQTARLRYAGLFEDSIDPILITDLKGSITEANHRAESFLGFARDILLGESVLNLHKADEGRFPENLGKLEPGQTISYEAQASHKSGDDLPIEVYAKRIDIEGKPALQWILRDISERLALDELRSDLTSMIFHDLRAPLGNVLSSLEVLKSSLPTEDEDLQTVLGISMRSGRRLSRLVESLLDIDQIESGQAVLHKTSAAINSLITEAVEEVHPIAEAKGHVITFDLPSGDLRQVDMDVDMIRRVLINLLENSIKYTRTGGRIHVAAHENEHELVVSVADDGPGIAPRDQHNIFDKFARIQHGGRPKGLGLGLAFCRLALEAHEGRIWVESESGEGSTFAFSLPT
jgi:PAS domain S-box-containing protein